MITIEQIKQCMVEEIKYSGVKRKQIAQKLGISDKTLSSYMRGNRLPPIDFIANLCVLLDLDANDILCINHY